MTERDVAIAEILTRSVPQPPRELEPGEVIRRSRARRRRQLRSTLAPALAAVLVIVSAGAVLTVVRLTRTSPDRASDRTAAQTPASPRAVALAAVHRLLAATPVLPGATETDRAPLATLAGPSVESGAANLLVLQRWWTAPGSVDAAVANLSARVPAGLILAFRGSGQGPGGSGRVESAGFDADAARWRRGDAYTGLQLSFAITAFHGGVAVEADAQAIWIAPRDPLLTVSGRVTSVEVAVYPGRNATPIRRSLGATDARTLARLINRLPQIPAGVRHCPRDTGSYDTLAFHGPGAVRSFTVTTSGCAAVTAGITPTNNIRPVDDAAQELQIDGLPQAIRAAMHLR
jgi:hypothetical protein